MNLIIRLLANIFAFLKTTAMSIVTAMLVFFSPIAGVILIVSISTIIDTGFGIWRAKKTGIKATSKKFRFGFIPKVLSYVATVMLVYTSDVFLLNELLNSVLSGDFLATKIVALILILNEVKSIDESFEVVKGYSFLERGKNAVFRLKDIKKEIEDR